MRSPRLTGGKGAELVFDAVGGPNFEKLADATAVGGILIVYGRFSPDVTPLPIAAGLMEKSDDPWFRSPYHDCTRR